MGSVDEVFVHYHGGSWHGFRVVYLWFVGDGGEMLWMLLERGCLEFGCYGVDFLMFGYVYCISGRLIEFNDG